MPSMASGEARTSPCGLMARGPKPIGEQGRIAAGKRCGQKVPATACVGRPPERIDPLEGIMDEVSVGEHDAAVSFHVVSRHDGELEPVTGRVGRIVGAERFAVEGRGDIGPREPLIGRAK